MKTLYISDLDGTLFRNDAKLSDRSRNIINDLVADKVNISLATARSISSAADALDGLYLSLPAVMMNGVFLTDINTKEQKSVCYFEKKAAKAVVDAFEMHDRPPFVYSYTDDIDTQYTAYHCEYERNFIEIRKKRYRTFEQVSEYKFSDNIIYINAIDEPEIINKIAEDIKNIPGISFEHYPDTYSGHLDFIEVFSDKAGKWNGIQRLKEKYGFQKIVAFGDNLNDMEMIKNADIGICVENSHPELLKCADIVIDSNENDGVANWLLKNV
ncbi:MAG: HAD family hydrolase [Oscillospiraceae bacterium]